MADNLSTGAAKGRSRPDAVRQHAIALRIVGSHTASIVSVRAQVALVPQPTSLHCSAWQLWTSIGY